MSEHPPTPVSLPPDTSPAVDIEEKPAAMISGWIGVGIVIVLIALMALPITLLAKHTWQSGVEITAGAISISVIGALLALIISGFDAISPGQALVVQLFGAYVGTVRTPGFVLTVPATYRKRISVRVRTFESSRLKVNDAIGNPVEMAAIVVWQVLDTARSAFAVDDYEYFVQAQAEAAIRHVAVDHPYDDAEGGTSLRGSTDIVAAALASELSSRVGIAGVTVVDVRISHLAYAPEIAQAMLQRQQATAIIAARSRIVDGAVGMVEQALDRLAAHEVVELDEERKAAMVSNLLVVLCGDSRVSPVVNAGTLYQ
jgi:regulator of protease activity HflC (stomatin/prohibitin superfamily)